ncbi:hypothetical protein TKWG_22730 [Advenella kashmirensis WT001]|uniref:TonB-dependent siderophore receptor n=1 Tax=Advenella kashmirensis (strain DSM 17095 / LMG 22695 / WT001) TaxID=1036672 RepID=I3UGN3_ADVKW|nr:hypothetical protein TKWG_22730 [Advenella kashmirensis WT001]
MTFRYRFSTLALAIGLATASSITLAQTEVPAVLEGHAILPANSSIAAPDNAPEDLKSAGKYTTRKRVEKPASVMGKSNDRETGISLPISGQPCRATPASRL